MKSESIGAIVSRGVGLGLIVIGGSALLSLFQGISSATSGWTSYSPDLGTTITRDVEKSLHDTYFVVSSTVSLYIPQIAQVTIGFVMILLSRPIGGWLARGFSAVDDHDSN